MELLSGLEPSDSFFVAGPAHLSTVHRVLVYGFHLNSSHWVFPAWTLSLPQPLTTLGANLYLYLPIGPPRVALPEPSPGMVRMSSPGVPLEP